MGDVNITDIASSLSKQCRYGGHCRGFYSVAEHSVLVYQMAKAEGHSKTIQRACLMHDATEAIVSDMPKPVKVLCPEFNDIEARIYRVIATQFGLPIREPHMVKHYDLTALEHEMYKLFPHIEGERLGTPEENGLNPAYLNMIVGLDYKAASHLFIGAARDLGLV